MTPKELFAAGDLKAAIAAATQQVKSQPNDAGWRTFLFELLAFSGELDRAGKQLEVVAHQDMQNELAAQVYLNLLHAEGLRQKVFSAGQKPEFLLDPPAWVHLQLDAVNRLREQKPAEAEALLHQAAEGRADVTGEWNGKSFADFRDCDDILAPVLELMLIRDYIWLPLEQVRELEVAKPERPRDLIWTPVRVTLADGSQRRAYMPARYPRSEQNADDAIKLGRATDWQSVSDNLVLGAGQREFFVGDESVPMLQLETITLAGG